jgi:hypothetical protein
MPARKKLKALEKQVHAGAQKAKSIGKALVVKHWGQILSFDK